MTPDLACLYNLGMTNHTQPAALDTNETQRRLRAAATYAQLADFRRLDFDNRCYARLLICEGLLNRDGDTLIMAAGE